MSEKDPITQYLTGWGDLDNSAVASAGGRATVRLGPVPSKASQWEIEYITAIAPNAGCQVEIFTVTQNDAVQQRDKYTFQASDLSGLLGSYIISASYLPTIKVATNSSLIAVFTGATPGDECAIGIQHKENAQDYGDTSQGPGQSPDSVLRERGYPNQGVH